MKTSKPRFTGKDYSVYNPMKVRLGMRLWTESFIRALPQHLPEKAHSPEK